MARERVEQQPRLLGGAGAELDQRPRARQLGDLGRALLEDLALAAREVVLGQPGDLVEELAPALVVEPLRRELPRPGEQACARLVDQEPPLLALRGQDADVDAAGTGDHSRESYAAGAGPPKSRPCIAPSGRPCKLRTCATISSLERRFRPSRSPSTPAASSGLTSSRAGGRSSSASSAAGGVRRSRCACGCWSRSRRSSRARPLPSRSSRSTRRPSTAPSARASAPRSRSSRTSRGGWRRSSTWSRSPTASTGRTCRRRSCSTRAT